MRRIEDDLLRVGTLSSYANSSRFEVLGGMAASSQI
jgi:hypothetical protein